MTLVTDDYFFEQSISPTEDGGFEFSGLVEEGNFKLHDVFIFESNTYLFMVTGILNHKFVGIEQVQAIAYQKIKYYEHTTKKNPVRARP